MSIRTNYKTPPDRPDIARLQRKIDQHMEMMSLAIADGDKADAERHRTEYKRLQEEVKKLS